MIRPFGGSGEDWGEARAGRVYANSLTSHDGAGFVAEVRHAQLQAYLNQGLMIIATFSRLADGKIRVNREYFRSSR